MGQLALTHEKAIRLVGALSLLLVGIGMGVFLYFDKALIQDLYSLILVFLGSAVTLVVQMVLWPGRFLPKKPTMDYQKLMTAPLESTPTIQAASNSSVELFQVSILPNRTIFHRGQFLLLRMRFKGRLTEGYRAATATFSDKTFAPIYDLTTLPDVYAKGTLDGPQDFDEQWPWRVPDNAPIGPCELFIAPCTMVQDVGVNLKLRRSWLHFRNRRRIDLAKPIRQAVRGETLVITLVE